ncbi:unnamed protein product, partial [Ascophyllum nodosum]
HPNLAWSPSRDTTAVKNLLGVEELHNITADIEELMTAVSWGRDISAETKLQVMTDLRDGIVAHEDLDLDETIVRLGKELGTDAEKVVIEALQGKSVEDGRNLLMYA